MPLGVITGVYGHRSKLELPLTALEVKFQLCIMYTPLTAMHATSTGPKDDGPRTTALGKTRLARHIPG